jgi:branched-chain amino acid transport system permease protein
VEVMSISYFGADFVDIAVYGLLLLILFIRPTGLFAGITAGQARA